MIVTLRFISFDPSNKFKLKRREREREKKENHRVELLHRFLLLISFRLKERKDY